MNVVFGLQKILPLRLLLLPIPFTSFSFSSSLVSLFYFFYSKNEDSKNHKQRWPNFLFICESEPKVFFFFIKRWFQELTNRQIPSLGVSQLPSHPNEMGWIKSMSFFIDLGCNEAKFNQSKGGLLFLTLSLPIQI